MLVLSRKTNQELVIGDNIRIKVLKVKGNTIRLGIEAPDDVRIVRGELRTAETIEANITIVHTDPNGPTYTDSEPAISPTKNRRSEVARQQSAKPQLSAQPGENRLRQLVDKIALRDNSVNSNQ